MGTIKLKETLLMRFSPKSSPYKEKAILDLRVFFHDIWVKVFKNGLSKI